MIHTTRWYPDTCPCVLEYTWNDTDPESTRVHTYSNTVNLCIFHAPLSIVGINLYNKVVQENQNKNTAFGICEAAIPGLTPDNFLFSWNAARTVLTINLTGLLVVITPSQTAQITTNFATQFGTSVVFGGIVIH